MLLKRGELKRSNNKSTCRLIVIEYSINRIIVGSNVRNVFFSKLSEVNSHDFTVCAKELNIIVPKRRIIAGYNHILLIYRLLNLDEMRC